MKIKKRLDAILADLYPHYSRTQLQSWIIQGKVFVDDQKVTKPGAQVNATANVILTAEVNEFMWTRGIQHPPRRIRIRAVKTEDDIVTVFLA